MTPEQLALNAKVQNIKTGLVEQIESLPRPVSSMESIIYSLLKEEGFVVGGRASAYPYVAAVSTKLFTDERYEIYQGLVDDYIALRGASLGEEMEIDCDRYVIFYETVQNFTRQHYGAKATFENFKDVLEDLLYKGCNLPLNFDGDRKNVLRSRILEVGVKQFDGAGSSPENYSLDAFVEALNIWD